ncbi:MAG: phenylalanine--tRNA ligase subunit beta [Bacteroidota bacterium]
MRISLNWLQRYVQFNISHLELAKRLTLVGLEVEDIEELGSAFDKFVVGDIVSVKKHPNADRLSLCEVRVDRTENSSESAQVLQIVCGAPNVLPGQKVAVGMIGAIVPKNQHDPEGKPFTLSKVKVRGEESNGMICSEYELGLGKDASGILVLDHAAKVGMPLARYLGLDDVVFEIGVTPNRPDCLSHIGIAREVAPLIKRKLVLPKTNVQENRKTDIRKNVSIEIRDKKACLRYSARLIMDVKVAASPQWLLALLNACNIRPINNIVDVANFVMHETGQPLHTFDYDKILGKKIVVKNASEGEKFTTLDGVERTLASSTLMICDGERAVAIAGVMGGSNSEISDSTTSVLIESACFEHSGIRKTAKQLGISSDASFRFERGTDPNGTLFAADRAAILLAEIAGGRIQKGVVDVYPKKRKGRTIQLRLSRANKILGTSIPADRIRKLLTPIGIKIRRKSNENFVCVAPTFRADLEQEIDIIEEIARLFGYANIPDKMVTAIDFSGRITGHDKVDEIRHSLEGLGFNEVVTNSLVDDNIAKAFAVNIVRVKNPISKDLSALRPSMVISMLQTVFHNFNNGTKDIRVFEIAKTYQRVEKAEADTIIPGFLEKKVISLCLAGRRNQLGWDTEDRLIDIYDLKGVVEGLLDKILLDKFHFIYYDSHSPLTEETIAVEKNGTYIGFLGKVKGELLKKFSLESDVYVSELSIEELTREGEEFRSYIPASKFPPVTRDLAFIVEKNISSESVGQLIRASGAPLLKKVTLFDVFSGEPLRVGKKSFAFALELNSSDKTLTEEEADTVIRKVVSDVCAKFGAELRS